MDEEFDQFDNQNKKQRRITAISGILLIAIGAFFIYVDWIIVGSVPSIFGVLFLWAASSDNATKDKY